MQPSNVHYGFYSSHGLGVPQTGFIVSPQTVPMTYQPGFYMQPSQGVTGSFPTGQIQVQGPGFNASSPQFHVPPGSIGNSGAAQPHAQAHFAGFSEGLLPTPGWSTSSGATPGWSASSGASMLNPGVAASHGMEPTPGGVNQPTPWYFDSGATSHITNNLQNITQPQPNMVHGGVQVGNGSQLQVTHSGTGQDFTSNSIQGTMQQGPLSSSELL